MRFQILSIVAFATVSLAENQIQSSLSQLSQTTVAFDNTIARWRGDFAGLDPIIRHSADLITTIKAETSVPEKARSIKARNVEEEEEEENFAAANQLVQDLGAAVDTGIGLKPKIEAIPALGKPFALTIFGNVRKAVAELGEAHIKAMSEGRREEAKALVKKADDHLLRGITALQ